MTDKEGVVFMTADDVERNVASVDPSRGIQLSEVVRIIRRTVGTEETPVWITPYAANAPAGDYAMFVGPQRDQLTHVFNAERLEDGAVNMFDAQNGQSISPNDLLTIRLKWGLRSDAPIIPVMIKKSSGR